MCDWNPQRRKEKDRKICEGNYPNLIKSANSKNKNMKKTTLKYIIIKLLKTNDKEKIFYKSRVKRDIMYRVTNIRIKVGISYWKQYEQEDSGITCLDSEKKTQR